MPSPCFLVKNCAHGHSPWDKRRKQKYGMPTRDPLLPYTDISASSPSHLQLDLAQRKAFSFIIFLRKCGQIPSHPRTRLFVHFLWSLRASLLQFHSAFLQKIVFLEINWKNEDAPNGNGNVPQSVRLDSKQRITIPYPLSKVRKQASWIVFLAVKWYRKKRPKVNKSKIRQQINFVKVESPSYALTAPPSFKNHIANLFIVIWSFCLKVWFTV